MMRLLSLFIIICCAFSVIDSWAQSESALFVVGNSTLNAGDQAIKTRLEEGGFEVTLVTDAASLAADAESKSLVLISSTSNSNNIGSKFRDVQVPVIVWEAYLFDDMNMTGAGNLDIGTVTDQTQLEIVGSSHPLTGGLDNGNQSVTNTAQTFMFGAPWQGALKIARIVGDSTQYGVFAYEKSSTMGGMTAPARRIGFFLHDVTADDLTASGQALFDAAVDWAIAGPDTKLYTVTLEASEGGTVSGGGVYPENSLISIYAVDNSGYDFVNWTSGGTELSGNKDFTFTLTGDTVIRANFTESTGIETVNIGINEHVTYQTMDGFGGFGAKTVWWGSAPFFNQAYVDLVVDDLGCDIIRTQLYWDFEVSNDNDDPDLIDPSGFDFSSGSDNGKQKSYMIALKDAGVDKQIASVWTPPIWMKLDPDNSLAVFCNGQCGGTLNPAYEEEFAEYIVAYIQKVKEETGVDLYGISLQNEPLFPNPFESCVYTETSLASLIRVVGARLRSEGLSTKIFGPEHMGSYSWLAAFFHEFLDDSTTRQYLDIFAVHGYLDGVNPSTGSAGGWTSIYNKCHQYDKPLWMTETSGFGDGWPGAFNMVNAVHLALKYGKVSAWVYWQMSDNILDNGVPNSKYYVLKNYYRYIRKGAVQVESTSDDKDVLVTAFKHPEESRFTIVLINKSGESREAVLDWSNLPGEFTVYRTSETENCIESTSASDEIILNPASVTTLVWDTYIESTEKVTEIRGKDVLIYPNPGSYEVTLDMPDNYPVTRIDIKDLTGKTVKTMVPEPGRMHIPVFVGDLKSGLYLVNVKGKERSLTLKLMKQ